MKFAGQNLKTHTTRLSQKADIPNSMGTPCFSAPLALRIFWNLYLNQKGLVLNKIGFAIFY